MSFSGPIPQKEPLNGNLQRGTQNVAWSFRVVDGNGLAVLTVCKRHDLRRRWLK